MRRVLLGLALGALIFGVAFAGAKVATVTNPMSATLDGGGYDIGNVGQARAVIVTGDELVTGRHGQFTGDVTSGDQQAVGHPGHYTLSDGTPGGLIDITGGTADPRDNGGTGASTGGLYLRHVDSATGELWLKSGACATCWAKVATVP